MLCSRKMKFWKKWYYSTEFERLNLVKKLTGIDELNSTLINSYFEDLEEYIESEIIK